MANTKLTSAEARALAGQGAGLDPNTHYAPDSQQTGDPLVDRMTFLQHLVAMTQGIPLVADANFKPPIVFFDDFFTGGAELNPINTDDPETDGEGFKFGTVNEFNDWFVGGTNAATGSIIIPDAAIGGWIQLTTAGAEEDALQCQLLGTPFKLAEATPLYFEARIMVEDTSETSWFVGLAIVNCTEVTGSGVAGASDDAIGFYGIEEDNINYFSSKDGTDTKADTLVDIVDGSIATMATASVARRLSFYWDGIDTVKFYVDGVEVADINTTDDDINQDECMSPIIAVDATAAGTAERIWVDYIYVAQQRP